MSAVRAPERDDVAGLDELPVFDYEYLYDDEEHPSEVTIFVDDVENLSTHWITADVEHAVPLERVR